MTAESRVAEGGFYELALSKMSKVLGQERAQQLIARLLQEHSLSLRTADDLFRFASELSQMSGFEGAIGAMLSVRAVMSGAKGTPR